MAFRWSADDGPRLNADLVALCFQGIRTSVFAFFFKGGRGGVNSTMYMYDKVFVNCQVDFNVSILPQITQRGHRATTFTENYPEGPVLLAIYAGKCSYDYYKTHWWLHARNYYVSLEKCRYKTISV